MLKKWGREIKWLLRAAALGKRPERVFLGTPPGHFYSPIPSMESVSDYPNERPKSLVGIDLREQAQLDRMKQLSPLIESHCFTKTKVPDRRFYFENVYFPYSDSLVTQALLRFLNPARLIEVGSGYSSACMLDTKEHFNLRTQFTFIDPYPERINGLLKKEERGEMRVLAKPVQSIPLAEFEALESGDILFIDSSHVVKFQSDVHHLFFEILPRLNRGVWIHIHDVFWPFEYPKSWLEMGWAWNENYFVRALLNHSARYQMELFPSWLEFAHPEELKVFWPQTLQRAACNTSVGGASLWISIL